MNDFDIPLNSESSLIASPQELVPNSGLDGADLISGSLKSSNSAMLPTLEEDVLRYEAEELNLTNYFVESNIASSGGKHISLVGSDGKTGTAAGVFNGEAGTYQVNVGFYDENDGVSSVDITVAGDTQSFLLDKDLPGNAAVAKTLTSRVTHSDIELQPGDDFKIEAQQNVGEFARFDYIEFTPLDTDTDTPGDNNPGGTDTPQDASTYYVSSKGSDDNPGTKEQPWKTIDYAVGKDSTVKAGDTILVQPGTYTELITLDKSGSKDLGHITLKADGEVTLRDPDPINGGFREGVIQSAGEGYWIIDGFRIENTSWAGIALRDANNMIVQNNHTFETGASGIIVLPESYYQGGDAEVTSKDIKVVDNTIERANWRWTGRGDTRGTQEALSIWGVDGFEVANNVVKEGKREGIDAKTGSRNGSIHNNTVTGVAQVSGTPGGYNGGPAIYVDGNRADTFNIDIYSNIVYSNVADGIVIADEAPQQGDVKDIRVYNNVVYGNGKLGINGGVGIMVTSNVSDVEVINNTVANNIQSILIDGTDFNKGIKTSGVVVRNNIFADAKYRNGFIEDANDVVLDNNLFTDTFEKLYETGNGLNNFKETNNTKVKSIGFLDSKGNNYHLSADSPAIDIGSDAIPDYASIDKDEVRRDRDDAPDMGAYEYRGSK
ncbi:right-handed parallel beta-helix repeat-containing protein [Rivularia sp. UHCC 0363]|uniref:right-handed parallel beta-helix repeat-containing protein n=1 Tax=Rivularia sp. UHCC 0363 TaxID=3110244 RepID=UPI002B21311B|nr:right-handed parallel beta-helix repeat-containing protein [Rivularia sp. UHCC 0363]MEA5596052.1 right-handed parallel beta-helix repeat-containing protein [Rivularia sp. UHCC 0363]